METKRRCASPQPNVLCVSLAPLLHIVEGHGHPASSDGMLVSPPSLGVAEQNACYLCSERRGVSLRAPGLGKVPSYPPPAPFLVDAVGERAQ